MSRGFQAPRYPTSDARLRRFIDQVAAILDSFLRAGIITPSGVNEYTLSTSFLESLGLTGGGSGGGGVVQIRGIDANRWLAGQLPPRPADGNEGDLYFQAIGGIVWEKKSFGFGFPAAWYSIAKLPAAGPKGDVGPQGIPGPPGHNGANGRDAVLPNWVDNYHFETKPSSANSMDDEFDDTAGMSGSGNGLNARWTWRNQGASTATYPFFGYVKLTPPTSSATAWRIIEQPFPGGDFTVEASVGIEGPIANFAQSGITLWDNTGGDGYNVGLQMAAGSACQVAVNRWNSVSSFNSLVGLISHSETHANIKVTYNSGANTMAAWVQSVGGVAWQRFATWTNVVGADRVGLGVNEENNTGLTALYCDYFRRTA